MKKIETLEKFKFDIGGFHSSKFEFLVRENMITFYCYDFYFDKGEDHRKEISNEAMDLFISNLNELSILNWNNKYDNNAVTDGEQWEIEIEYNSTRRKKIYGSNDYPGSKPESSGRTVEFNEFLEVLKLLIQDPSIKF